MKKMIALSFCLAIVLSFKITNEKLFYVPKGFPKPTYDFTNNKISKAKIELGRMLFYETQLSKNNTISCANCHLQYSSFTHVDHALSHGIDDKIGKRNSPVLVNLAWQKSFMWDGAINHLDMQALAPISNATEMDEKIENVVSKLNQNNQYKKYCYKAFKDSNITGELVLKSLSQFMLTFISANSKYDSVMQNLKEFTAKEKNGYNLFKQHCASCHTEPLFTNSEFENNGLLLDKNNTDYGRMIVTNNKTDSLKFKVPTLRNIEFSYPYMHDGRFKKLSDVINHYANLTTQNSYYSTKLLVPIALSSNDKVDLIAFILTLTDKKFLFNKNFSYSSKTLKR